MCGRNSLMEKKSKAGVLLLALFTIDLRINIYLVGFIFIKCQKVKKEIMCQLMFSISEATECFLF